MGDDFYPVTVNDQQSIEPVDKGLVLHNFQPLERNPAAVYLASLRETGRRTQKIALDQIACLLAGNGSTALNCNWSAVRYQHTAVIRTRLAEKYAPATTNKMLSALRRVLKETWKLGYTSAEDYHRAASVENVSGETLLAGRGLMQGEISSLMMTCVNDSSLAGARDAALIALLYSCGLRRAEAISLNLENYDQVAGHLDVSGKRNKQRRAYLIDGALDAMNDWISFRGFEAGPLFWPVNKSGKTVNRRLTTQAIYIILLKRALQSHLKRFSPHDLRRTFVSDLLDAGADISTVSRMAGHSNVQTTARYDRRPEDAKKKAATLLHVPYQARTVG